MWACWLSFFKKNISRRSCPFLTTFSNELKLKFIPMCNIYIIMHRKNRNYPRYLKTLFHVKSILLFINIMHFTFNIWAVGASYLFIYLISVHTNTILLNLSIIYCVVYLWNSSAINDVTHFVSKALFLYKALWIDYRARAETGQSESSVPKQEVQLSVFLHVSILC